MEERKIVTLYELAKLSGRQVNECLYIAQEAKALRLQPGDSNIHVDLKIFQDHLESMIVDELKVLNGKESED
jgi:hypothetical protein